MRWQQWWNPHPLPQVSQASSPPPGGRLSPVETDIKWTKRTLLLTNLHHHNNSGNYSNSCKSCNITWSHVYLSPVTLTTTQSPPGLAATITATTLSTPHWDDLYLVCASCANLNGIMQAGGTVDLSKSRFFVPLSPFQKLRRGWKS